MKRKQQGFSLLEVSLILLIMGIVGVAAVPTIIQAKRQEVDQVARELCIDLCNQKMNDQAGTDIYIGQASTSTSISSEAAHPENYSVSTQSLNNGTYSACIFSLNSTGNIYSIYHASQSLVYRECPPNMKITIYGTDASTANPAIKQLSYEMGSLTNNLEIGTPYSTLIIKVENHQASCSVTYIPETGYYSIS